MGSPVALRNSHRCYGVWTPVWILAVLTTIAAVLLSPTHGYQYVLEAQSFATDLSWEDITSLEFTEPNRPIDFKFIFGGVPYSSVHVDKQGSLILRNCKEDSACAAEELSCSDLTEGLGKCKQAVVALHLTSDATVRYAMLEVSTELPSQTNRAPPTKVDALVIRWVDATEGAELDFAVILQSPSRILFVYNTIPATSTLFDTKFAGLFTHVPSSYDSRVHTLVTELFADTDLADEYRLLPIPPALIESHTIVQAVPFGFYTCVSPTTVRAQTPSDSVSLYFTTFADPTYNSGASAPALPAQLQAYIPSFITPRLRCDFKTVGSVTPPLVTPARTDLSWDPERQAWYCTLPQAALDTILDAGAAQSTVTFTVSIVVVPQHPGFATKLQEYTLFNIKRSSGPLNIFQGDATVDERSDDLPTSIAQLTSSSPSSQYVLPQSMNTIELAEGEALTDDELADAMCTQCAQHRWGLAPSSLIFAPTNYETGPTNPDDDPGITNSFFPLGRAAIGRGRDVCFTDCFGTRQGTAIVDQCGVCSGGDTGHVANSDTRCGICFGPPYPDGSADNLSHCAETASIAPTLPLDDLLTREAAKEAAPAGATLACSEGGHICQILTDYVPKELIATIEPLHGFKRATLAITALLFILSVLHLLGSGTWQQQQAALAENVASQQNNEE